MDAQYRRKHGCQQHLQWHRYPAYKQPDSNTARHRAAIQMPYHRLGKGIANPATEPTGFLVAATEQMVQPIADSRGFRQTFFEPITGHDQFTVLASNSVITIVSCVSYADSPHAEHDVCCKGAA